jgi:Fur family ferric uptake transcriptional regulator
MGRGASADVRQTLPHSLARRGLRLTGPRRAVLDVLAESREPLTVTEIHARLTGGQAHVVSVYRTVHLLVRLRLVRPTDVVRPTDATRGSRRYELGEEFTGHHHHLICQGCGRIEDLDGCWLADAVLTRLTRYVRRTRRFEVSEHEVRLFGLCRRCAT